MGRRLRFSLGQWAFILVVVAGAGVVGACDNDDDDDGGGYDAGTYEDAGTDGGVFAGEG